MGARAVPRAGVGSRPGVNVERGVNTVGSPELGGRGAGANGGTGVSPSRGVCLTTIFTTPVLFTMVGGICSGRGCPTASWRTWAPVKVSLLPWIWKVRGLLPPALATGRCAREASCPMLTTSPATNKEGAHAHGPLRRPSPGSRGPNPTPHFSTFQPVQPWPKGYSLHPPHLLSNTLPSSDGLHLPEPIGSPPPHCSSTASPAAVYSSVCRPPTRL